MSQQSYPELIKKFRSQGLGILAAEAQIEKTHPGLKDKWQAAEEAKLTSRSAMSPRNVQAIKSRNAAPANMTPAEGAQALAEHVAEREAVSPGDSSGGDYFSKARQIAAERGIKFSKACEAVNREFPYLWREMLKTANPGRSDKELFGEK